MFEMLVFLALTAFRASLTDKEGLQPKPHNCLDLLQGGNTKNGVYTVYPFQDDPRKPVRVFCDMLTDGGGWTVIQKRFDGSVDFYRSYAEYAEGFGDVAQEHYLGNDIIAAITDQKSNELRVELEGWGKEQKVYAHYEKFKVDNATYEYQLHASGYSGTAGDSLTVDHPSYDGYLDNDGKNFTTFDMDNDVRPRENCGQVRHGGWWFSLVCGWANLNGQYHPEEHVDIFGQDPKFWTGIFWYSYKTSYPSIIGENAKTLKATTMLIRPKRVLIEAP